MAWLIGFFVFVSVAGLLWACLLLPERVSLPARAATLSPAPGPRRVPLASLLAAMGRWSPGIGRQREGLQQQLVYLGSAMTLEVFQGLRILSALGSVLIVAVIARELGLRDPWPFLVAGAVGFFIPDLWLRARLARQHTAILRLLPEAIDLLTLCVEAGLDFVLALKRVTAVPQYQKEPLVAELSGVLHEMSLGKRRSEALRAMAKRVGLPELTSFVRTMVQADRMGTPIAQVLAAIAEDMRLQRLTRAERAALKAPIKILGPLIFCIMPCVGILIGAPIFLQFMRQNPFAQ